MSAMSDYLENKSLDHCLGTATFAKPAGTWVGLFTSDPGESGNAGELVGNGYVRLPTTWTPASGGQAFNVAQLQYGPATAAWGTVTHFAVYDAVSAGNMLYHAPVDFTKNYITGDVAIFLPNDLKVVHQ